MLISEHKHYINKDEFNWAKHGHTESLKYTNDLYSQLHEQMSKQSSAGTTSHKTVVFLFSLAI